MVTGNYLKHAIIILKSRASCMYYYGCLSDNNIYTPAVHVVAGISAKLANHYTVVQPLTKLLFAAAIIDDY